MYEQEPSTPTRPCGSRQPPEWDPKVGWRHRPITRRRSQGPVRRAAAVVLARHPFQHLEGPTGVNRFHQGVRRTRRPGSAPRRSPYRSRSPRSRAAGGSRATARASARGRFGRSPRVLISTSKRSAPTACSAVATSPAVVSCARVKTGTSSPFRDAWALAYSKRWTVGAWVGDPPLPPDEPPDRLMRAEGLGDSPPARGWAWRSEERLTSWSVQTRRPRSMSAHLAERASSDRVAVNRISGTKCSSSVPATAETMARRSASL